MQKNRDRTLHHILKINSKWIYLKIRAKTIKLLEEYTGKSLWPWTWQQILRYDNKGKKIKWTHWNKKFCTKDVITKIKRQAIEWMKIFVYHISHKSLLSRIHNELYTSATTKKKKKQRKKWVKDFPGGSMVKNPPANVGDIGDTISILDWKDPLEEEMATHSSILPWRIPWTEKPGGLQPKGSQGVRHNWARMRCL